MRHAREREFSMKFGLVFSMALALAGLACVSEDSAKRTGKGAVKVFFEGCGDAGWTDSGYALGECGYRPLCNAEPSNGVYFAVSELDKPGVVLRAVGIGGDRSYSAPDLVRGVRCVAETGKAFALHVTGTPEGVKSDAKLTAALDAVRSEAERLGVRYVSTATKNRP